MGPKVAPERGQDSHNDLEQGRRRGEDIHFYFFWTTLQQKLLFLEMYEKPEEKHGFSRVREGPGAQVRATWAQKLRPRGSGRAKGASGRAAGGVRTIIWRYFGRLYGKSHYFLKCMKKHRKSMVFQGLERVQAPKLEALEPQSRARRRSERPKIASEGQVREVRTVKLGRSGQTVRQSYGTNRTSSQT